jgi:hypothetical protein
MNTMFQLTRSGMVFSGSDADIEAARDHFEENDWIRFPSILDRELWELIQQQLAASNLEGKSASIYPEFNVSDSALTELMIMPAIATIKSLTKFLPGGIRI